MPVLAECSHCDPPGSGQCRFCHGVGNTATAKCPMCYGSGYCRHCHGTGVPRSPLVRFYGMLLSVWWISWFGIIPSFFFAGVWEYRYVLARGSRASYFSLTLLVVTALLWILFFAVDHKARGRVDGVKNKLAVARLLTLTGTILGIFTLLGILFFIYVAPNIH
jgi:hypothetical protein